MCKINVFAKCKYDINCKKIFEIKKDYGKLLKKLVIFSETFLEILY